MPIEALTNKTSVYSAVNNGSDYSTKEVTKPEAVDAGSQDATDLEDTSKQGRYEVENAQNVSPDKIKKAVDEINQKIKPTHTSCQFSYHDETNRIFIKVIDDDTDKVIREIPPEKTLDMIAKTLELEGILVDEKR